MLDPTRFSYAAHTSAHTAKTPPPDNRPALRMTTNDRMAGSVPVWERAPRTESSPSAAAQTQMAYNAAHPDFPQNIAPAAGETAHSPAQANTPATSSDDAFGFFDLLDMVNPLQHIPIISNLYRNITGDEIKPVSRIIGGTIFGGAVGGAASLANVIVEHETGRDITGNVVAMVRDNQTPQWRSTPQNPEQNLDRAVRLAAQTATDENAAYNALPPQVMAFAAAPIPYTPPTPAQIAALPVIYIE